MAQATFHFPTGFMWGTATSSHQVEGNNTNNNWWAWEQQPGRIVQGQKSGLACDWWGGRWKEDLDRAAETGQNAHRLSIEWSRVQPAPDRWDENALDQYREIIRGICQRGMTPLVTLHHFTDPLWLTEMSGWENEKTPALFAAYCRKVVEALKEYVTLWCTINEPNIYVFLGYLNGIYPPGRNDLKATIKVATQLIRGHGLAYHAIHEVQPQARVGIAVNYESDIPARKLFLFDRWIANFQSQFYNNTFPVALRDGKINAITKTIAVPEAANTQDFLGINYYTRALFSFDIRQKNTYFARRSFPRGADLSPNGFLANMPEGLFEALKWANRFEIPIIITENGAEDAEDGFRRRYLVQHLQQVWRAVNFNIPVKGYFHWSLVDNFEWERGWTQRFGLWELEIDTQVRRKRPSVDLYAEICRENGISSDMVARYAPSVLEKMFPGVESETLVRL